MNKDKSLVLTKFKENPDMDIHDLHNLIDDKISWKSLMKIFTEISQEGLINRTDLRGAITPLGETKLNEFNEALKEKNTITELTIKELKGNVFQIKYSWLLLIINFIIAIGTSVVTMLIMKTL